MSEQVTMCAESPCASCPWRVSNRGKPSPIVEGHKYRWYSQQNLNRLWRGIRNGERMTCHPTDSRATQINGKHTPDSIETRECAGSLILAQREMMIAQDIADKKFARYRRERPRALTLRGLTLLVERAVFAIGNGRMGRPNLNELDVQYEPLGEWKAR